MNGSAAVAHWLVGAIFVLGATMRCESVPGNELSLRSSSP
jgi:hypothetical protein